jgi:hypothetical protein
VWVRVPEDRAEDLRRPTQSTIYRCPRRPKRRSSPGIGGMSVKWGATWSVIPVNRATHFARVT